VRGWPILVTSSSARVARSFVLPVDKPVGPTSHDVVAWARRALGTRAIGHAGTLDPAASGVLVLAIDEGTKLVPYLTLDDKEYDATITLGAETDTLDAEGEVIERAEVPPLTRETVQSIATSFVGPSRQRAPIFSAIKRGGVPLHELARKGEDVEAPERDVEAFSIEVRRVEGVCIDVHLHVGKGYYVRSFARDLSRALGTVGHLTSLRRTRSGNFAIDHCLDGALLHDAATAVREGRDVEGARASLTNALSGRQVSMLDALPAMPTLSLDDALERDARHGKRLAPPGFESLPDGASCKLVHGTTLVAIARREGESIRVVRGFVPDHDGAP